MIGPLPYLPVAVQALAIGAVTLLAFAGLGWLFASGHPYRALFLAMLVAPSLPYLITHVSSRYRYPINGFVCLLCCECLARLIGARGEGSNSMNRRGSIESGQRAFSRRRRREHQALILRW